MGAAKTPVTAEAALAAAFTVWSEDQQSEPGIYLSLSGDHLVSIFNLLALEHVEVPACPHCGGTETEIAHFTPTNHPKFAVACLTCGAGGPETIDEESAWLAWRGRNVPADSALVPDLVMLVRRLAAALVPDHAMRAVTMVFLKKHNLQGSPLREEK